MRTDHRRAPVTRPAGVFKLADAVASQPEAPVPTGIRTGPTPAAALEPLLGIDDLASALNCSRRVVERMRSARRPPRPDLVVGNRMPRWKPATISAWIDGGGRP
jgi:hypothetical protein